MGRSYPARISTYRVGYEGKWAFPIDPARFPDLANIEQSLDDFCAYCNIQNVPPFQRGLT
jgi:hypothetical protein